MDHDCSESLGVIEFNPQRDSVTAPCTACGATLSRFWIDAEDDRNGRWSSPWAPVKT